MDPENPKPPTEAGKETTQPKVDHPTALDTSVWETSPLPTESTSEAKGEEAEEMPWRSRIDSAPQSSQQRTEPFHHHEIILKELEEAPASRIGLLGGRSTGKSYLFHGIIYRTLDADKSGAVSRYMKSSSLKMSESFDKPSQPVILSDVVGAYTKWITLLPTPMAGQRWYQLRLKFKAGILGTKLSHVDVEFLDGSGEGFALPVTDLTKPTWIAAFRDARIMVFCLPIWAVFPRELNIQDQNRRKMFLKEFETVVANYMQIRNPALNVRSILALTMADDDKRCSLGNLIQKWIKPYMNAPQTYLKKLKSKSGIPRYLANAHAISNYLHEQFQAVSDPLISKIPGDLDFGKGLPWIIPVSAIEGAVLERTQSSMNGDPEAFEFLAPPVPAHVELPLLAALCENHNALM